MYIRNQFACETVEFANDIGASIFHLINWLSW